MRAVILLFILIGIKSYSQKDIKPPKESCTENLSDYVIGIDSLAIEDLMPLKEFLCEKRIVLLGESSHGVKEYSLSKIELIKFLHQECGFNTIIFESPMDKCALTHFNRDSLSSKQMLVNSLFGVWHTKSNVELFRFIKDENLKLFGIDPQFSYLSNNYYKYCYDKSLINNEVFSQLSKTDSISFKKMGSLTHKTVYKTIFKEFFSDEISQYEKIIISDSLSIEGKILKRVVENRIQFLSHGQHYRDTLMAQNVIWNLNNLPQNEKVIVWAHNSHIRRTAYNVNQGTYMGNILNKELKENMYVIGLYAYSGKMNWNNGKHFEVKIKSRNSLENILGVIDKPYSFIDFSKQTPNKNNKWIFKSIPLLHSGIDEEYFIPKEAYDGIFFVRKVCLPEYIKRDDK